METSTAEFFHVFFYNYVEKTNYYFDIQNDKNSSTYDTID